MGLPALSLDVASSANSTAIRKDLAAPFAPADIAFTMSVVSAGRALALPRLCPASVRTRLSTVLGATGFREDFEELPEGCVVCRLKLLIGERWELKLAAGTLAVDASDGKVRAAAFDDAFLRAALQFGVGAYLYRLPAQWLPYDAGQKRFTVEPSLPTAALPAARPRLANCGAKEQRKQSETSKSRRRLISVVAAAQGG